MGMFANPRNLLESFGLVVTIFRLTGIFPFYYQQSQNKFLLSWKLFAITLFHVALYIYVNITSLMENWYDYSQPMIGHSSLSAFGNLLLRLLDVIITLLVFIPPVVSSHHQVQSLNLYMKLLDELELMGIDVSFIYRRIYYLSFVFVFIWIGEMIFSAWHSIYFFEHITQRPPELKYYLVVTLSKFYKLLFIFYGNSQFFALLMISKQLNCYLKVILNNYQERYANKQVLKNIFSEKFLRRNNYK